VNVPIPGFIASAQQRAAPCRLFPICGVVMRCAPPFIAQLFRRLHAVCDACGGGRVVRQQVGHRQDIVSGASLYNVAAALLRFTTSAAEVSTSSTAAQ